MHAIVNSKYIVNINILFSAKLIVVVKVIMTSLCEFYY